MGDRLEVPRAVGRTAGATEEVRALSWMACQLRWERTLDALRAVRRDFPKAA